MSELSTQTSIPRSWNLATALLLGAALACAAPVSPAPGPGLEDVVKGPGTVFASVEDAALDALAWCHESDRKDRINARVRGGTIEASAGGFTYVRVVTAKRHRPHAVSFSLRATDVASFRHFPATGSFEIDRANEFHSSADRATVDQLDPLHRVSYLLTPRKVVRAYMGNDREIEIAQLDVWAAQQRGSRRPIITIED